MVIENKFTSVMSKKTDAELIRIVTIDEEKYQLDAVTAAEKELKSRNLTFEQTKEAHKTNKAITDFETAKAEEPLDSGLKVLVFMMPTKAIIQSGLYAAEGYDRKSKEIMQWCYYGFGFYISIFVLIWLISRF